MPRKSRTALAGGRWKPLPFWAGLVAACVPFATAAQDSPPEFPQALPGVEMGQVELAVDRTSYAAGERAQVAVRLVIKEGWHTPRTCKAPPFHADLTFPVPP